MKPGPAFLSVCSNSTSTTTTTSTRSGGSGGSSSVSMRRRSFHCAPNNAQEGHRPLAAEHRQRTFVALKPDCVQRQLCGTVLSRFEQRGFKLQALKVCLWLWVVCLTIVGPLCPIASQQPWTVCWVVVRLCEPRRHVEAPRDRTTLSFFFFGRATATTALLLT
jgi:hypothetical protein